jgi:hypothetical protein
MRPTAKGFILIAYLLLAFHAGRIHGGTERVGLVLVPWAWSVAIRKGLLNWDGFMQNVRRLPGPEWMKERIPHFLAGEVIEAALIFIVGVNL